MAKKRGRKRNSLRKAFEKGVGQPLYFAGLNPDFIVFSPARGSPPASRELLAVGVDRISNEKVGVKVVDMEDKDSLERAENELRTLREVGGESCVIDVRAAFSEAKVLHIVFPHAYGGSLYQEVSSRGAFSEVRCRSIFSQMAECLHFLHTHKIAHRNLTIHSVLLRHSRRDEIWITEFGDSVKNCPQTSAACSPSSFKPFNPLFSSPEILRSNWSGEDIYKSDWWSMGVIAYVCLTTTYPFFSNDRSQLADLINKNQPNFPEFFSWEARDLLSKLLEKDPKKRIGGQQTMKHPWVVVASYERKSEKSLL